MLDRKTAASDGNRLGKARNSPKLRIALGASKLGCLLNPYKFFSLLIMVHIATQRVKVLRANRKSAKKNGSRMRFLFSATSRKYFEPAG